MNGQNSPILIISRNTCKIDLQTQITAPGYLVQVVQAQSNGPIPKRAICVISGYVNASFMGVHVHTAWI